MSKETDFISLMVRGAQEVQITSGMFASVTIAQAILETGWGKSHPVDKDTGAESYNLFGIKAKANDPKVYSLTTEIYSKLPKTYVKYENRADGKFKVWIYDYFRKFNNYEECIAYRAQWLTTSKYWTKARTADTPQQAVHYLQNTGYYSGSTPIVYATDTEYENKLNKIIKDYKLSQYDLTKEEIKMISELQSKVDTLEKEVGELKKLTQCFLIVNPTDSQKLAVWAKTGFEFVTAESVKGKGDALSDGTRPESPVTRQEVWVMLARFFNRFMKK